MKKSILILIGAALMLNCNAMGLAAPERDISQKDEIQIYTSNELFNLVEQWTDLYSTQNANADIKVSKLEKLNVNKERLSQNNWILASDAQNEDLCSKAAWKMLIGRDPVIAVTSSKNPHIKRISEMGLSKDEIKEIISGGSLSSWGVFLDTKSPNKIEVFLEDNSSVRSAIVNYTGIGKDKLSNKQARTGNELISQLENNPEAVGFIRLSEIITQDQKSFINGIVPLPLDLNANNKIDSFEDIYKSTQSFLRGSWIGKYPREMLTHLYMISDREPTKDIEISFLTFLMINGNEILTESNFISLIDEEAYSAMNRLDKAQLPGVIAGTRRSGKTIILIISTIILLFLIPGLILRLRRGKAHSSIQDIQKGNVLTPEIIKNANGILFDKSHTWAFMEKDGNVRIGIDDFLQHVLGSISKVKLLSVGDKVTKGEKIISISNKGKQVSIKSPVSGTIIGHNHALQSSPSLLNTSPQSEGWIYTIEPHNWQSENSTMLMGSQYISWVRDEISRLKDFLLWALKENHGQTGQLILTDGGDVPDNTLDHLEVEVWEEFQQNFIDQSKNYKYGN